LNIYGLGKKTFKHLRQSWLVGLSGYKPIRHSIEGLLIAHLAVAKRVNKNHPLHEALKNKKQEWQARLMRPGFRQPPKRRK
jgi:hypothetical protein